MRRGVFEVLKIADIVIDKEFNVYPSTKGALFDDLQNSLCEVGQIQNVIVNRTADGDHLVAGEQRVRALMEGDADTVECKVFEDMTELEKMDICVDENERRRAPSPLGQARGMKRMRELGRSTGMIADKYGCSDDMVLKREKLLKLPKDVQEMMEREKYPLPVHQAEMLAGLSESKARQLARSIAPSVGPVMGEKETRDLIDDEVKGKKLPDPGPKKKPDLNGPQTLTKKPTAEAGDGVDASEQGPGVSGGDAALTPAAKKNADDGGTMLPVKGGVAITPANLRINAGGQLTVTGVMTIKVDAGKSHPELHSAKLTNFVLDLDAKVMAEVVKMMKGCQPKAAKKKAEK